MKSGGAICLDEVSGVGCQEHRSKNGLAKTAWFQMLTKFGKKTNTSRKLPPGSSEVQNKVRRNKSVAVLTNAIDYIGYLDKGGKNTPPSNILAKSRIQMEERTEKQLKRHGKILKKIWRR